MHAFDCPRTCPMANDRWCRFGPVLSRLGPVRVDSHTAKVKVDYRDGKALQAAVEAMGGTWLGQGSHRLYDRSATGLGFRLPGWNYPLVLESGGELAYDDYNGRWGNVADLERLKSGYTLGLAEQAAQLQGWQTERTTEGLLIHHPSGGTLTITGAGQLDALGFQGAGCHDAITALNLPLLDLQPKAEFSQVKAETVITQ